MPREANSTYSSPYGNEQYRIIPEQGASGKPSSDGYWSIIRKNRSGKNDDWDDREVSELPYFDGNTWVSIPSVLDMIVVSRNLPPCQEGEVSHLWLGSSRQNADLTATVDSRGLLHSDGNRPALSFKTALNTEEKFWFKHGELHRKGDPAIERRYGDFTRRTGVFLDHPYTSFEWWENGNRVINGIPNWAIKTKSDSDFSTMIPLTADGSISSVLDIITRMPAYIETNTGKNSHHRPRIPSETLEFLRVVPSRIWGPMDSYPHLRNADFSFAHTVRKSGILG